MSVCQYGAVGKNGHGGSVLFVAEVDPALCQGCGACAASCPSRAIALSRFADVQVLAQIQAALAVPAPAATGLPAVPHSNGSRVLGFRCNWCSYDDSDLPFDGLSYGAGINAIRVPCVGRIDPLHVVWAFLSGADGVFLGGCPPDNCRYARGSGRAEERFSDLRTLLDSHGIDSRRLRLEWIERDTPNHFSDALRSFAGEIAQLGVLSTR
jgi:heterodisulfide reductase subunit A